MFIAAAQRRVRRSIASQPLQRFIQARIIRGTGIGDMDSPTTMAAGGTPTHGGSRVTTADPANIGIANALGGGDTALGDTTAAFAIMAANHAPGRSVSPLSVYLWLPDPVCSRAFRIASAE